MGWWAVAAIAMVVTTVWFTGLGSLVVTVGVLALSTELAITALSANLNAWLVGRSQRSGSLDAPTDRASSERWSRSRGGQGPADRASRVAPRRSTPLRTCLVRSRGARDRRDQSPGGWGRRIFEWFEIARYTGTTGVAPASVPGVLPTLGAPSFVVSAAIPVTMVAASSRSSPCGIAPAPRSQRRSSRSCSRTRPSTTARTRCFSPRCSLGLARWRKVSRGRPPADRPRNRPRGTIRRSGRGRAASGSGAPSGASGGPSRC